MKRMAIRACARLLCCVVLSGVWLPCDVVFYPRSILAEE